MALNIKVLEESFALISPQSTKFSARFYFNLFNDYPQLQPLFENTNMAAQEKKLVMSLVLVINNLRNLAYLETVLKDLGEKHVRYGAIQEHYPIIGTVLLKTLESCLGTSWTPEVKQAWIDGYDAIVSLMLEGANEVQDNSQLQLENILERSANSSSTSQAPLSPPASELSRDYLQDNSSPENGSTASVPPAKVSQTPPLATPSSQNYLQDNSSPENGSTASVPPPKITQTPTPPQPSVIKFGVNLKLLLSIFAVLSVLGVGFLYYQSIWQQDNNDLNNIELR